MKLVTKFGCAMDYDGHIFISYKSEQRHLAFDVRNRLQDWGFETWLDVDRLHPGTYWADDIDAALKSCSACVGLMTPVALDSRYVTNEWDMAIMKDKPFIPLMFEYTEPHYKYLDIQYVDFVTNKRSAYQQLKMRLEADVKSQQVMRSHDPYHDYLQKLYNRINKYLSVKLITSLRDTEGRAEPIKLSTSKTNDAVTTLFEEKKEIDPLFEIGGIESETTDEFDTLNNVVNYYDGRLLLLGEPGSGKTISLLHHARDAIVKRYQDHNAPLPILGVILTWDAYSNASIVDWLVSSYGAPENARNIIEQGNAFLFLDGLDELGDERPIDPNNPDGESFDPRQRFVQSIPPLGSILLTCRLEDYRAIGEQVNLNGAVTLKPLADHQLQEYLEKQPELLRLINQDIKMRKWLSKPLQLSFFAFAYEKMTDDEKTRLVGLSSTSELSHKVYDTYIQGNYDRLLAKPDKTVKYTMSQIYDLMGWVSMRNIVSDMRPVAGRLDNYSFVSKLDFSEIIDFTYFMLDMNILIATDEGVYQFVHLGLRDHFASNYALKMILDAEVENRINAVYVFEETKDQRAIPLLIDCLADRYARVRGTAAELLGEIGDARAIEGLIELTKDGDRIIKRIALASIAKMTDPNASGALVNILNHENPALQQAAYSALSKIGHSAANQLISALSHDDPVLRGKSAQILGEISFKPALNYLEELLNDTDEVDFGVRVCDFAQNSINLLKQS